MKVKTHAKKRKSVLTKVRVKKNLATSSRIRFLIRPEFP
ncbi:hypothetical protein LEP1GSC193_0515 [Leptospira alstonii serovar Pingchang str. 80-412]|uniref:Uncharacterized protein n=2 Tax=Leptospira alstonii TaxID=28452 RepID=M6CKY5_9LEPT|nr:hypothetical protein LEP1GSC194_2130 [Leptospira alstonii serovar Sichuan str. 79601]EQA79540.1 hypothetical protein LEP1GSC193_0515 [Leptospira alstonii serovar Pingchang str. 80-412]